MTRTALRTRLAELVAAATDGEVSTVDVLGSGVGLGALGVGSLGLLRLVDAVEAEYDLELDLDDDPDLLDSVDRLADHLVGRGVPVHDD